MAEPPKERSSIEALMRAGPTQQQLEQFKGPTSQTNLPGNEMPNVSKFQMGEAVPQIGGAEKLSVNMKMKMGPEDQPNLDQIRLQREMRMEEMFGRNGYLPKLFKQVEELKTIKDLTSELDNTALKLRIRTEQIKDPNNTPRIKREENKENFTNAKKQLEEGARILEETIRNKNGFGPLTEEFAGYQEEVEQARNSLEKYTPLFQERARLNKELELSAERDKVRKNYENVTHSSLDEMNALNIIMEHFRDAYPYESRWMLQYFEQTIKQVNEWLRNDEILDDEGKALARMLKLDLTWCLSVTRVGESMGPAYQNFFDGEVVVSKQNGNHTDILTEDLIGYLDKQLDGLELTDDQRRFVVELLKSDVVDKEIDKKVGAGIKPTLEQRREAVEIVAAREKLGLRERAVELQDIYGKLLYDLVGSGQKNWELSESGKDEEEGEHYAIIDNVKRSILVEVFNNDSIYDPNVVKDVEERKKFLKENAFKSFTYIDAYGRPHIVKKSVLNPFCMDRNDERVQRVLRARLQEIVLNYDHYFNSKYGVFLGIDPKAEPEDIAKAAQDVAKEIITNADKRLLEWEQIDANKDWDFRLTDTVMRNINILETGLLATGDLGWSWRYKKMRLLQEKPGDILEKADGSITIGPDGKPQKGSGTSYIMVNGEMVLENDKRYSLDFWKLVKEKLVFKENKLGRDREDLFSPKPLPPAPGTKSPVKYERELIDKTKYSKEEWEVLNKIAIRTFIKTDDKGRFLEGNDNPDLKRIQIDERGNQFIVKRESEMGSIYEAKDITTLTFWARHVIDYDAIAYSRSTLLFPTIGWYREMWKEQPPYWRPRIEYFAAYDTRLLNSLGLRGGTEGILSKNNKLENMVARNIYKIGATGIQEQKYGPFNQKVADYIRKNAWAFVTPWTNDPGSGGNESQDYFLVQPMFLSTSLTDFNFWRTVTLEEPSAKVKDHIGRTAWHKRLKGMAYSELGLKNMDVNKPSWEVNNTSQLERWLGPFVTPHNFNRATLGEVEKMYNNANGLSEAEAGKRAGLSVRGNEVEDVVVRTAVFNQNRVFASVSIGNAIANIGTLIPATKPRKISVNDPDLRGKLHEWVDTWIIPWVNTLLDKPPVLKELENYSGTSAQVIQVTGLQTGRIIASGVVNSRGQQADVAKSTREIENIYK